MKCEGASAACTKVICEYFSGKENGVSLAEACLKPNNFSTFCGWFGQEITRELAKQSEPSQFWSVAHQHWEAKALGLLAVKMTSAFSGQGAVRRYHKSIGLIRDRYSNLKQQDTVQRCNVCWCENHVLRLRDVDAFQLTNEANWILQNKLMTEHSISQLTV